MCYIADEEHESMTKTDTVHARIEPELKTEAESVLKRLGLSPTQAIRLFYRQVALRRGLPFSVEIPNEETQAAMRDALDGDQLVEWADLETLKRAHR
jgi:DNA-damage-inducible protein J